MHTRLRWLLAGTVLAVAALVGGPFVYINVVRGEAPAPLTLAPESTSSIAAAPSGGEWTASAGSQVGYRVNEVLFGQRAAAVGRTDAVTGSMKVDDTTIESARFTVDMTTVRSDQDRRDRQFNGRIMDTTTYPTSTFELSEPISFDAVPGEGEPVTRSVSGKLTLRGTTRTVTFDVTGRRTAGLIEVTGSIPITFAEWNIPNPSFGAVATEDRGVLEFALKFTPA